MLRNMKEELGPSMQGLEDFEHYFAITRRYAVTAFAGWRGDPAVSDRDFVVAAYQASQIRLLAVNVQSWSQSVGVDRVPSIEDKALRQVVSALMSIDYTAFISMPPGPAAKDHAITLARKLGA